MHVGDPPARGVTVAVAAHGLRGTGTVLPFEPLAAAVWTPVLRAALHHRIAARLARCVEVGALPVRPGQAVEAFHAGRLETAHNRRVEEELLAVSDLLDGCGIDWRVLKGSAHAQLGYSEPALRSFADIDLLVPGAQLEAAVRRLLLAGGTRRFAELRPGFDRRFTKSVTVSMPAGVDVDLHRTLAPGPFGLTLDPSCLFDDVSEFVLAGHRLRAMGPDERFLHACYHAVLGDAEPRLVPLRDVVELHDGTGVDIERVRRLAEAWAGQVVLADAVRRAWRTFALPSTPLLRWAVEDRFPRRQERALALYRGPDRSWAAQSIASLAVIRGPRRKVAYAWAVAVPRREAGRRPLLAHWGRGARTVWDGRAKSSTL